MKIARVFPTRTSMTPVDPDAYVGLPTLFTPKYDKVYISCTFTWDIKKARRLVYEWGAYTDICEIGGPAIDSNNVVDIFVSNLFLRQGITITSRGCPNSCSYCLVSKREGKIKTLPIVEGNIIQDNNFLACPKEHKRQVYKMLRGQRAIEFKGGLDKFLLTDWDIEQIQSLRIKSLWLACDNPSHLKTLIKVVERLHKAGFNKNKLFCFVIVGKDMEEEKNRMKAIFNSGCMPFAQLFRNEADDISYTREWKQFARKWSRPAIIKKVALEP